MAERKKSESNRRVRIMHDRVGDYAHGQVVDVSDLHDPDSLYAKGAIIDVDENAVDEDQGPTLFEAMHSESPPTLPNAPFVGATEEQLQQAAGLVPPPEGSNVALGAPGYVGPEELRATPVPPMGHNSPVTHNVAAEGEQARERDQAKAQEDRSKHQSHR